jgi:REP element-mobilizing transposase RayT
MPVWGNYGWRNDIERNRTDCEKRIPKQHGLPEIVRAFKTFSARKINELRYTAGISVWQCNYYEHIIRNNADYDRIAEYITHNPKKWENDCFYDP